MEQHVLIIVIDYRGHHWKGNEINNAIVIILHQKTFVLRYKNVFFDHCRKVKTKINIKNYIIYIKKM
jgi:hypothetical protein